VKIFNIGENSRQFLAALFGFSVLPVTVFKAERPGSAVLCFQQARRFD